MIEPGLAQGAPGCCCNLLALRVGEMHCFAIGALCRKPGNASLCQPDRMARNGRKIQIFCFWLEKAHSWDIDSGDQWPSHALVEIQGRRGRRAVVGTAERLIHF
jgi:hypothetical protein